jgi:hypothetical protein
MASRNEEAEEWAKKRTEPYHIARFAMFGKRPDGRLSQPPSSTHAIVNY